MELLNTEILNLSKKIYGETQLLNLDFQKKVPCLKNFQWPSWEKMFPELQKEYYEWVLYLVQFDLPYFSASERHTQAVGNRIAAGWVLGEKRNDKKKEDPYLIHLSECPDWMIVWCRAKDNKMISEVKKFLAYGRTNFKT